MPALAPRLSLAAAQTGTSACSATALGPDLFRLHCGGRDWAIFGLYAGQGAGFIADLEQRLADALDAVQAHDDADLMEVHPASAGGTWIFGLFCPDGTAEVRACWVQRPEEVSTAYAEPRNAHMALDIADLHSEFTALTQGVFDGLSPLPRRRPLRVKVHGNEHWFMRFPLPMFVQMELGSFARHASCQWIVTPRTFAEVAARQKDAESRLSNTWEFLRHSRVLINTYQAHAGAANARQLQAALDLVVRLLGYLQRVSLLEGGEVSLRWSQNPSPQEVLDTLLDGTTRFVFANFEARGGVWTTGDSTAGAAAPGVVDVGSLKGRLAHVLLLRVFHCHSLFSPFRGEEDPVSARTLGHALLESGALFVEGSITEEPQMGYYCTLLHTLLGRNDIRMLLYLQAMQGGLDYGETMEEANRILVDNGYEVVDAAGTPLQV